MGKFDLDSSVVMRNIIKIRGRYDACTARELARKMQMNEATLRRHLMVMVNDGLLSYNEMPGSLNVTRKGLRLLVDEIEGAIAGSHASVEEPESDPEPAPVTAPVVKKRAAKKRAPRRRADS